jgi:hypothetical protein
LRREVLRLLIADIKALLPLISKGNNGRLDPLAKAFMAYLPRWWVREMRVRGRVEKERRRRGEREGEGEGWRL